MRKVILKSCGFCVVGFIGAMTLVNTAQAKPAFTGINFSGTYACKGNNEQVGDYEVTAVLKLNRVSSYAKFGAYDFSTETDNASTYKGQAVADGLRLALSYTLTEGRNVEYSTGIAEMKKTKGNVWSFRNQYYEPDDSGGNYGFEYCVMKPTAAVKTAKALPAKRKVGVKP
ncbi:MAG TPA: hypothetical protein VGJ90_07260 [Methylophilaceae bacterium]|jgi:hypothetical protein